MRARMDDAGPDDFDPPCEVCGVDPDDCKCPTCPKCGVVGDMDCYDNHGLQNVIQQAGNLLLSCKKLLAGYDDPNGASMADMEEAEEVIRKAEGSAHDG